MESYFGTAPNTNHRVDFIDGGNVRVTENRVLDVDAMFDCVGIPDSVDEFMRHAQQYSRLCTIAVHRTATDIRFHEVMSTQCALMGSRGYDQTDIEEVIANLASGRSKAPLMVSHRYPLEQAAEALAPAADPPGPLRSCWTWPEYRIGTCNLI